MFGLCSCSVRSELVDRDKHMRSELVDCDKFWWSDFAWGEFGFVFNLKYKVLNLRFVCCFPQFKKLMELSAAIFDSSSNILVIL